MVSTTPPPGKHLRTKPIRGGERLQRPRGHVVPPPACPGHCPSKTFPVLSHTCKHLLSKSPETHCGTQEVNFICLSWLQLRLFNHWTRNWEKICNMQMAPLSYYFYCHLLNKRKVCVWVEMKPLFRKHLSDCLDPHLLQCEPGSEKELILFPSKAYKCRASEGSHSCERLFRRRWEGESSGLTVLKAYGLLSLVFLLPCKCVDGISTYAHKCYLKNSKERWFSHF